MPQESDAIWEALNVLRKALNDAYWKIADQQEADRFLALAQDIDSIQDDLDRAEIKAGTAEYNNLKRRVDGVNKKLDRLKKDIDKIIHSVETVTKVVGYIDQAVALAAKYFV